MLARMQATRGSEELLRGNEYARRMREMFVGVDPVQRQESALHGSAMVGAFGAGRVAAMRGGPMLIQRRSAASDVTTVTFNLFVNVQGSVEIEHSARFCELAAGDALLLDGSRTFAADMRTDYSQMLVQFPRAAVARRHPEIIRRAGVRFPSEHPAVQILAQTAHLLASRGPSAFDPVSQAYAYEAMLTMLGALPSANVEQCTVAGHRFVRALADLDAHLSDPSLSAATLANLQGISRRRLDAIFATRGLTAEQVIWSRRLTRAANEIGCARKDSRKLLEIALGCGFSSEAHFSRRFREHFGVSPREYRNAQAARLPSRRH